MTETNGTTGPFEHGSLLVGEEIGRGGQASVFELVEPDLGLPMLYKQYLVAVDQTALDRVIEWRTRLSDHDRGIVDKRTSWPRHRVVAGDRTVGVLIPRAPEPYTLPVRDTIRLREISYLCHADRSRKLGIELPDAPTRLEILARLSEVFDVLQRNGVVHGDISFKNVLWATDPEPSAYLLDCDSATIDGQPSALPMATTPHWTDPRLITGTISRSDLDSDRLALGLASYRVYFQTAGSLRDNDPRLPIPDHPPVDRRVTSLFERTLTMDTPRPHPEEWTVLEDLAHDLREPSTDVGRRLIEYVPTAPETPTASMPVFDNDPKADGRRRSRPAAAPATPPAGVGPTGPPPATADPARLDVMTVAAAIAVFVMCAVVGLLITRAIL